MANHPADAFERWQSALTAPPLQKVTHPLLTERGVELRLLRTDRVHQIISGNKAYKLRFNLLSALEKGAAGVLSFGGAWSNHLHALAYSCNLMQLPCAAVIRGEADLIAKSAMLQDLERWGCQLHFVSRQDYRLRDDPQWLIQLSARFPDYLIVPEGGSSALAASGVALLSRQLESACLSQQWLPDQVWCAVGTGGTLAGLIAGRQKNYRLVGMPVLKGADFLYAAIEDKLSSESTSTDPDANKRDQSWRLLLDGHWGGYGKVPQLLLEEMRALEQALGETSPPLSLDPVYTGKLFTRFWRALEQNEIAAGSRALLIHTGGLQGRRGYNLPWV